MTEETHYNYDSHGNLSSKYTDIPGRTVGAASDSVSILKDDETSTVELYDYDGFDRMVDVHKGGITAEYTYNAEGIRTSKSVNGATTTFTLDGVNVIAETTNNQTTQYIRGLQLIESIDSNNTKKYYSYNGHDDVTNLTDSTGAVVQTYAYDPFGVEIGAVSGDTNPFRYCAEYFDKETGDIYLRARYYSASIGRWNASDPAMSGLNWYVYCANNPIALIDLTGEVPVIARYAIAKYTDEMGTKGGNITFDEENMKATITIGSNSVTFDVEGLTLDRIIVDSDDLEAVFGMPAKDWEPQAGDSFATADEAGLAFGLSKSEKESEWGANIYKQVDPSGNESYFFDDVTQGGAEGVAVPDPSKEGGTNTRVGFSHVHGTYNKYNSNSEYLSGKMIDKNGNPYGDAYIAKNKNMKVYLVTPKLYFSYVDNTWVEKDENFATTGVTNFGTVKVSKVKK